MSSCIWRYAFAECSLGYYGQGFTADEYVCGWYTNEGIGGIMHTIFNSENASWDIRLHFYRNETNDGSFCRSHDVRLALNLQFFADDGQGGEKTEEPTAKKLEDARKEGQVAKSKEIANGLGLLSLFLVLKFWTGNMANDFKNLFKVIYNRMPDITKLVGNPVPQQDMKDLFQYALLVTLKTLAPILLIGFIIAFLSDYVQVKWKVTTKPLQPKFSKMNPVSGLKKIISMNSLVELIKSIAKILLIGWVSYSYLKDKGEFIYLLYDMDIIPSVIFIGEIVIDLGIRISAIYMIIAFADFAYQKYKFHKDMKMTKQEVKEEFKNQEGNPEIKGKIRQKMREVSQRRMMQALPEADVVITNPTHYAVAIKYDPDVGRAPIVIAKGEDFLAQKIKEVAREHEIEIVENKPLARMLYANVDIGAEIPPELYQAVAEVLAFVYHQKGKI